MKRGFEGFDAGEEGGDNRVGVQLLLFLLFLLVQTMLWVQEFVGGLRVLVAEFGMARVRIWWVGLEELRSNGLEKWVCD